ncbi:RDD family protein [Rhodovulum imhoffii]|uniref:RDD family protein n=1 Tax=Rhodovulum imhoffii TaxID=365340 RepID=A0A2T5BWE4_9RHOB|nr:RDD family protein [Rhodovulum imhoffii]MBK5935086.1 hypothetical protein [Rhodovulum imhoffii]PTN03949.1 RDD family protein [Rhodovulum imhoffii]
MNNLTLPDPVTQAEFYADVPVKRLVAWVIDTLIIMLLAVLALPFTAFTAIFFFPLFFGLIGFAYRVTMLTRGSATPGMQLVAIEFRSARGERFALPEAAFHTFLYMLCLITILPQVISIIAMLTSARRQSLPDRVLGSVAINRPAAL